ncbi:39S ribosomal protein L16, mitochondrial-like [Stegodyphus dumicola]|uniref:39S ribosomal protein L16, mitochondrial-like n=1 Tax=Stegodyphus dumicola TaxID=202533 RepID=UPI0015AE8682|nr:39S ribosomal protein L16, mitochondrial-like [Stegodyphus dumicola]
MNILRAKPLLELHQIPYNLLLQNSLKPFLLYNARRNKTNYEMPPPSFADIELPEQRKLPIIPKIPQYYINTKPPLLRKSHEDIRGPETVHNELLHKQYGIIALSGGYLKYGSIEVIRNTVNREMDTRKTFAVWRVDPLWKPQPKKGVGKRMGGGKGSVHHYATPVKAGRIVIEVGGKVEFEEVYPFLNRVAMKMPFDAMPISQQMLEELEKEAEELHQKNINPFSFRYAVQNDLRGCNLWTSEWDKKYFDEYI